MFFSLCLSLIDDEDDRISFSKYIIPEYSRIVATAKRILYDPQDAEDIAQETVIKVAMNLKQIKQKLNNENELANYVICIAKNKALNYKKKKDRMIYIDDEFEDLASDTEIIFRHEDREIISKHLDNLDDRYQIIIRLVYYNGFTVKEVAAALDRKRDTVEKQRQRGLKLLRDSMSKEEVYI